LAIDLSWVALSAPLALFIRDNFVLWPEVVSGLLVYTALSVVSAAITFPVAGLNRTLWRYTSLIDVLRILAVVSLALLIGLIGGFVLNRLEGIPRSVPVIQWFLLVGAMTGTRIVFRLLGERRSRRGGKAGNIAQETQHVLVVGVNDLSELYLRSVSEFAPTGVVIVGILASETKLHGRLLRAQKVLGTPAELSRVLAELEIHGVAVDRIVVSQPFEKFSKKAQDALRAVEESSAIKVDWLLEKLGLTRGDGDGKQSLAAVSEMIDSESTRLDNDPISPRHSQRLKRMIDASCALIMLIVLAPIVALTALLIIIDVGSPAVFWQWRPGRFGFKFKLFKFRTMRGAHDAEGKRIPDELRSSRIGRFLRRRWLDELPQLYNILVGEMSFVGPRPLLPTDQPKSINERLLVRPGLTGWAQVNGGRDLSPEDKAALDLWYIANGTLWLDIKIVLRTFAQMLLSTRAIDHTTQASGTGLEKEIMKTEMTAKTQDDLPDPETRLGEQWPKAS
jgi:lipopolysaccharide/colanic/teichoic acid biosynthesis glycosyltransferase